MDSTLTAYRRARAAAVAAAEVEAETRQALIHDAHEAGQSVRETSAMLGIPKSTVARIRMRQAVGVGVGMWGGPVGAGATWMTQEAYVAAHNAAWAHDETQHIEREPFTTETRDDGSRVVTRVTVTKRGVAHHHPARGRDGGVGTVVNRPGVSGDSRVRVLSRRVERGV